jgi:hypothetical protein
LEIAVAVAAIVVGSGPLSGGGTARRGLHLRVVEVDQQLEKKLTFISNAVQMRENKSALF